MLVALGMTSVHAANKADALSSNGGNLPGGARHVCLYAQVFTSKIGKRLCAFQDRSFDAKPFQEQIYTPAILSPYAANKFDAGKGI